MFLAGCHDSAEVWRRIQGADDRYDYATKVYRVKAMFANMLPYERNRISFSITGTGVQDRKQILVHYPTLRSKCREAGLDLVSVVNWLQLFQSEYQRYEAWFRECEVATHDGRLAEEDLLGASRARARKRATL